MNDIELKKILISALKAIAPETDPDALKPDDPIRQKLGLDSFDFLQFIIAIAKNLRIDIPEEDYSKVSTFMEIEQYLKDYKEKHPLVF